MRSKEAAIFIITYKNRYKELLQYANEIQNYDVYVVLQTNDDTSIYDEYTWKDHVHVVVADVERIGPKRQFCLDFAREHGYTYSIQFDDDIRNTPKKITPESKRTTSNSYRKVNTTIDELVDTLVDTAKEYNAAFVSPTLDFLLGFSQPGRRNVNRSIQSGQVTLQNVNMLYENNIKYPTMDLINEDIVLLFEILRKSLPCVTVADYCFCVHNSSNKLSNSIVNHNERYDMLHLNMFIEYPGVIKLYIDKENKLRIRTTWKNFPDHTQEITDPKFYEICKGSDIELIKKYIRENY
jgi:hypothetical protein